MRRNSLVYNSLSCIVSKDYNRNILYFTMKMRVTETLYFLMTIITISSDAFQDSANRTLKTPNFIEFQCQVGETKCTFKSSDGKHNCFKPCQRCDGKVDCPRATDEHKCPCKSKLLSQYICDGHMDCTDLSDELGCGECLSDELSCSEGCVRLYSFCEGSPCREFSRNLLCTRLSLSRTESLNDTVYRSVGYFQKRVRNRWYHVCGNRASELQTAVDAYCFDVTGIKDASNSFEYETVVSPPDRWVHIEKESSEVNNQSVFLAVESDTCDSNSVVYVKCQPPTCQNNSKPIEGKLSFSKIVGGNDASFDMWNFMVEILRNGERFCSGTVISSRWILSASHCFLKITGHMFEIEAGSHRKNVLTPGSQRVLVSHIIRRFDFNPYEMKNDVALLRLETPLVLTRWVRPVCLANSKEVNLDVGLICSVAGWGYVQESGILAKTLQEVAVPILSGEICIREYVYIDTTKAVCAGYEAGGKDSCQGDSGGPMMCNVCKPDDDPFSCKRRPWVQAGIVSFGRGCARPGMPGVYAIVESYRDWIFNTISTVDHDSSKLPTVVPNTECDGLICKRNNGQQCLEKRFICNGMVDCVNGVDETECEDLSPFSNHMDGNVTTESYSTVGSTESDFNVPLVDYNSNVTNSSCSHNDHYRCEISQECISSFLVCDEVKNCRDGSDEWRCSCVDRLVASRHSRICDGIKDCFDGNDEAPEICNICKPGFWFCSRSRECVKQEWRCNEKVDCRYGEDELFCLTLVANSEGKLLMNKEREIPQFSDHGHLLIYSNENSKWTPVCTKELTDEHADSVCYFLGYGASLNITYNTNLPSEYDIIEFDSRVKRSLDNLNHDLYTMNESKHTHVGKRSADNRKPVLLRDLRQLGYGDGRSKRETCSQVHIDCGPNPCGKIRDLHFSDSPPVGHASLIPWEVSLYVNGKYLCGGTLIHKEWVITASKCIASINLMKTELHVVGGSRRETRTGSSARLLGFDEVDFRIDFLVDLDSNDSDLKSRMSLLHLNGSIENFMQLSSVCLHSNMNESWKECVVAGKYRDILTYSLLLQPEDSEGCQNDEICFKNFATEQDMCSSNWSGVISCRQERSSESIWTAVGIWTYLGDDKLCGSKKYNHKIITNQLIERILNITGTKVESPSAPVPCSGLRCPIGRCIAKSQICDGKVSCANLEDEHYNCPVPVPYCIVNQNTKVCECEDGMFACSDRICIHPKRLCDGVSDCPNNEDENCTCSMKTTKRILICDGNIDCYDQTDELHCHCDLQAEYRCYRSPNQPCIDRRFLCDNVTDCANGEDEETCVTLSSTVFVEENALGIPSIDKEGYLLLRVTGRWFTYLIESWKNALSDRLCIKLGFKKSSGTFGRLLNLELIAKEYQRLNFAPINTELFRGNIFREGDHNVTYISCL